MFMIMFWWSFVDIDCVIMFKIHFCVVCKEEGNIISLNISTKENSFLPRQQSVYQYVYVSLGLAGLLKIEKLIQYFKQLWLFYPWFDCNCKKTKIHNFQLPVFSTYYSVFVFWWCEKIFHKIMKHCSLMINCS